MINFNSISMRKKISIPLIFIGLLVLILSFLGIQNNKMSSSNVSLLSNVFLNGISTTLNADRDLYQALSASQSYLIKKQLNLPNTKEDLDSFNENAQQALDRMNQVKILIKDFPELASTLTSFDSSYKLWLTSAKNVFKLADSGKIDEASKLNAGDTAKYFDSLRSYYDVVGEKINNLSDKTVTRSINASDTQNSLFILFVSLILIISFICFLLLPKLITSRINNLESMISEISEGDGNLTGRLDSNGKDELSILAKTFNKLIEKLQSLIKMIKSDAHSLFEATTELNSLSTHSKSISTEQNSRLEQIATAINELNYSINEVATNAQTAQAETHKAKEASHQTVAIVDQSVTNINNLSKSVSHASTVIIKLAKESENIAQVLGVIQGIAEQTNLLALNAAIEAARAGEQGRGFAVVADEVRTLASRTQQSTENIQTMIADLESGVSEAVDAINSGSGQVEEVVNMSQRVKESLNTVEATINQTNDIIYQIATATDQQSGAVNEINQNISSLNTLSSENLEVILNSQKASENIFNISTELSKNMDKFKV
ncbi:methyl-accepting chemotaxis protein [Marinomonas sp. 15G1-11]|uniref:Methyl-accepting chemotaxis protein n=1 Tax=Marinomonas phaeophyticola TaxID=3004091 RepID=A0ABT4JTS8_9GAMM|nr:methyl-accepting chemotaxis protein [Marinomonas sp. 15G1-11]MCZ2721616.1 methyl-accepting chemotaxis protein [Marinomonas sp. 15G1-11]